MNKLFIYYSNTGNGDVVADLLAGRGYDIRKVNTKHSLPKKFFFKVFVGGFLAAIGKKSKLVNFDGDVSCYDEVVIGSPVWCGKLSCPINTVLKKTDLSDKKVSFILYAGGGTAPKAEKRLKKEFPTATLTVLKAPKSNAEELNKL